MSNENNANEAAFPITIHQGMPYNHGLTKLEYAVIHGHYSPTKEDIDVQVARDRAANPHNDSYKPRLRSYNEIVNELKISHYKELLTQLSK